MSSVSFANLQMRELVSQFYRSILQLRSRVMPTAWELKQQHSRIIREGLQDRQPTEEDNWLMTTARSHQLPT